MSRLTTGWIELDRDQAKRLLDGDSRAVARLIGLIDDLHYYQAVTGPDHRRQLLVELVAPEQVVLRDLPSWLGLTLEIQNLDVADLTNRPFVVFQQGLGGTERVFEAVIEDVCVDLGSAGGRNEIPATLMRALTKWQAFFTEFGFDGLTRVACQGLFGELWIVREHFIAALGPQRCLEVWTGHQAAHQDFQIGATAIEMKTTIAKQNQKVMIASERQLDDVGLENLYLMVLSLSEVVSGETLPMLVQSLESIFAVDPVLGIVFHEALRSAGYLDVHEPNYSTGFAFRSLHSYRVEGEFPRLLERNLQPGVGDLTYSISLAACQPFEIPMARVISTLR